MPARTALLAASMGPISSMAQERTWFFNCSGSGEHPNVPSLRFLVRQNNCQNHPFALQPPRPATGVFRAFRARETPVAGRGGVATFANLQKGGHGKGGIRICLPVHCLPVGRTSNNTVTQMRHPLVVERWPDCARQSLASMLSALAIAATSYCRPSCHANVVPPVCLLPL